MNERQLKKFSNASDAPASNDAFNLEKGYADPFNFKFNKELKMGEAVAFRLLTIDADFIPETKQVACSVFNAKDGKMMNLVPVPQPDFETYEECEILDDAGDDLRDLMQVRKLYRTIKRVPVFIMYKLDEDRKITEEIFELRYIEMNYGLTRSFDELKKDVQNDNAFDTMPPYTLMITKSPGAMENMPSYQIKPCKKIYDISAKKLVDEETRGITDPAEALGEEIWDDICKKMDEEFIDHLYALRDTETKPENVKQCFNRYRTRGASAENSEVESLDDSSEHEVNDVDEVVKEIQAAESSEEKPKTTGRSWKSKKG